MQKLPFQKIKNNEEFDFNFLVGFNEVIKNAIIMKAVDLPSRKKILVSKYRKSRNGSKLIEVKTPNGWYQLLEDDFLGPDLS